jgi:hypothetical protein
MDHSAGQSQRSIEEQQVAVTESMGRVEARVQDTVEGLKSTVYSAMEEFK